MKQIAALILILFIAYSCNPVKQVFKDPVKMNEVAEEMIRRGYCSNDTTIITQVTDTFFIYHEDIVDTIMFDEYACAFDTVLKSGTRIVYDNGYLMINEKIRVRNIVTTKKVDNFIRDTKIELLLKQDIETYKDSVMMLQSQIFSLESMNDKLQDKVTKGKLYFSGLIILVVLFILYRMFKAFKPI